MGNPWSSQTCVREKKTIQGWSGLTKKEKNGVMKTMKKLSESPRENGEQLFLRFFKAFPSYKDIFPSFRETDVDSLEGSLKLRAHGMLVIDTLSKLILAIDDYHMFRTTLHTTVKSHFKKGVRIQNYKDMFTVFKAFLEEKCGNLDQCTIIAWAKVADMILAEMNDSMSQQAQLAQINAKSAAYANNNGLLADEFVHHANNENSEHSDHEDDFV